MKAGIISLGSVSSQMVAEKLKQYFDHVDMINLKEIEVRLGRDAGVYYQGELLSKYDTLYVKGSFRYAQLLRSITSMLEKKVPYLPLPSHSFTVVHNKLLTHLALQQHNIPMPRTYVSPNIEEAKYLLKRVNYPIVMKFPHGTQGKGVMFADSESSAASVLDALGALNQPFIIQEYIESGGTDVRVIVIGDRAVAAMRRRAMTNEKRANIHAGGSGEKVELTSKISTLAVKTAKALNADICGVDILEGPRGAMVIEANISPGLQGISKVVDLDIADCIAKHMFDETVKAVKPKSVLKELNLEEISGDKELMTNLKIRGDQIVLPSVAKRISGLTETDDVNIKLNKHKISIEKI